MVDRGKRNKFWAGYYEWALEQWRQEVKSNFCVLQAIGNSPCEALVRILRPLPSEEQLRTGHLLAKRFHPDALALLGVALTPDDQEQLYKLDEQRRRLWTVSANSNDVTRSALKRAVRDAVAPVLGTDQERVAANQWEYRTQFGDWEVSTKLEFPGQGVQMRYQHDISHRQEERIYFVSYLSAPAWLGVSAACEWSDISDSNLRSVTGGLALACRRFLEAIPDILPK